MISSIYINKWYTCYHRSICWLLSR